MRNLMKCFCILSTLCCVLVFSLIYVGDKTIPNEITTVENTGYNAPDVFGLSVFKIKNIESRAGAVLGTAQAPQNHAQIKLFDIIPVKNTEITNSKRQYVVTGGEIFGIKLYTDGVLVVGADSINGVNGAENPAETSGLKVGDIIKSANGKKIKTIGQLTSIIEKSNGQTINFLVIRNDKNIDIEFNCVKEKSSGKYKAGLWVRDSTAGLGTVTFVNPNNNSFAGLGHPICDVDTEKMMPLGDGKIVEAYVNGFYKSSKGCAGELCGVFTGKNLGELCINNDTGVYGYLDCKLENKDLIPVAVKQEVHEGNVKIICTIDNNLPRCYDAKIVKVHPNSTSSNKDMVIEITDKRLLEKTGGILQGMSGTPIIQDGMLVGAITHVIVNNPKQGYAIFAEKMLETSECRDMQKFVSEKKKAS